MVPFFSWQRLMHVYDTAQELSMRRREIHATCRHRHGVCQSHMSWLAADSVDAWSWWLSVFEDAGELVVQELWEASACGLSPLEAGKALYPVRQGSRSHMHGECNVCAHACMLHPSLFHPHMNWRRAVRALPATVFLALLSRLH